MAKLTDEQKALNKEATKLRDRAFRERKNAYFKEIEAVQATPAMTALIKATEDATSSLEELRVERENALGELNAQIASLQLKLAEVKQNYDAKLQPLDQARKDAWAARNKAEAEAQASIKARYEDVADCWSAAGWKSYEDFLPQATQD